MQDEVSEKIKGLITLRRVNTVQFLLRRKLLVLCDPANLLYRVLGECLKLAGDGDDGIVEGAIANFLEVGNELDLISS